MLAHEKAKAWREGLKLSIAELARMTGYSEGALRWFEWGKTPPRTARHMAGKQASKKIPDHIWQRYRNTCAGVEYQIKAGKQFDFGPPAADKG